MTTIRNKKTNPRESRSIALNVMKDIQHNLFLKEQTRLNRTISCEDIRDTCERAGCTNKLGYHSKKKFALNVRIIC